MESPSQNDHQQLLLGFSSSPPPSFFNGGSNQFDHCNQNFILSDANGVLPISSRDQYPSLSYESPLPPLITPMVQDLGFHQWASNEEKSYMNHSVIQQLPLSTMFKEQLSNSFPSTVSSSTDRLRLSSGELLFEAMRSLDNYSSILPTTNNSSSNPSTLNQISIDMDLQHLDLLASAKFSWILGQTSSINSTMASYPIPYFGLGHYEEPTQELSHCHHKVLSLVNEVTETKRANGILDHKASQAAVKAHQFEPPSSSSPFKVRKEKLGDRIASLQQLVAPFGKTDTASVLMEAIGYIKFLQDQVETLSVPYMRSSKKLRTVQGASSEENNECRHDLRSRGLCLVPLSCTSYVTNKDGGVWSLPKF